VNKIKLLTDKRLPPPDLIQAEISPFNQRRDLVTYAASVQATVVCAAWSKAEILKRQRPSLILYTN
jgi:hypothetical protein